MSSSTKRCGKTSTLLPVFRMVNKGLLSSNISPASLYRAVEAWRPTLCIDEADTFLKVSGELKGLLNSGHTRDTAFTLRAGGKSNEPRMFSTWGPKAVAAIGRLPDTIEDRSIRLVPSRKPSTVHKSDAFDSDALRAACDPVRRRIARWVLDNEQALAAATPARLEDLNDRASNNWRPLLAIASVARGEWPSRARAAAIALSLNDPDDEDTGILALRHIKAVFGDETRCSTGTILKALVERDQANWARWWSKDVGLGAWRGPSARLAAILKPFGIHPKQMRILGDKTRGFERADFEAAWKIYAPGDWQTYAPASVE